MRQRRALPRTSYAKMRLLWQPLVPPATRRRQLPCATTANPAAISSSRSGNARLPSPCHVKGPAIMPSGSDFILNALIEEGLTHLFLVPGGLIDPVLPALARHPIKAV